MFRRLYSVQLTDGHVNVLHLIMMVAYRLMKTPLCSLLIGVFLISDQGLEEVFTSV